MKANPSHAIPDAFGPDRMAKVWSKPAFERAKPFWEALRWLEAGHWKGVVNAERAAVLKQGVLKGIMSTMADLARQYDKDGTWRDRKWPHWRSNRTSGEDPQCLYNTGILPPRIMCWPRGEAYPSDPLELSGLYQEMREWSFTPGAAARFSEAELKQIRENADVMFGEFWKTLNFGNRTDS